MEKDALNKILLIITGSSLLTFAIGSYIINFSLSQFQIVDFAMLKPHAIIVGLMFAFFFLSHAFILLLFLDISEIGRNSIFKVLILTAQKVIYITAFLTFSFDYHIFSDPIYKLNILGYKFDILKWLVFFYMTCPLSIALAFEDIKEGKKDAFVLIYKIHIALGLISNLLIFIILYNNPTFQTILDFEKVIGFCFILFFAFTPVRDPKEVKNYKGSFFSKEPLTKRHHITIVIILICTTFVGGIFSLIGFYTRIIYPNIGQSFGGGKLEKITYVVNSDTISGDKIYESDAYIFLLNKDSSVTKLDWKDVKKIIKHQEIKKIRNHKIASKLVPVKAKNNIAKSN